MSDSIALSPYISPNDKFKNYLGNLIDTHNFIQSVVLARIVSFVAGSAIALAAIAYQSTMIAIKAPITIARIVIIFIPFVDRIKLASKLPSGTEVSTLFIHVFKIAFCVADIFLYPTLGTLFPRLHRFVSKISFLYHYDVNISTDLGERIPPPPELILLPLPRMDIHVLQKIQSKPISVEQLSPLNSIVQDEFERVRNKISVGCLQKLNTLENTVSINANKDYPTEFSSLDRIASTFSLRIEINKNHVEYDFGRNSDWELSNNFLTIPLRPLFSHSQSQTLSFEECNKDNHAELKQIMRSTPNTFGRILSEKLFHPISFDTTESKYFCRPYSREQKNDYLKCLFSKDFAACKSVDEIATEYFVNIPEELQFINTAYISFHRERDLERYKGINNKENQENSIVGQFLLQKKVLDKIDLLSEDQITEYLEELKDEMGSLEEYFEELNIDEDDTKKQIKFITKLFLSALEITSTSKQSTISSIIAEYQLQSTPEKFEIDKLIGKAIDQILKEKDSNRTINRESFENATSVLKTFLNS